MTGDNAKRPVGAPKDSLTMQVKVSRLIRRLAFSFDFCRSNVTKWNGCLEKVQLEFILP